jgi:polar amino acid transport system substrate-binding protein
VRRFAVLFVLIFAVLFLGCTQTPGEKGGQTEQTAGYHLVEEGVLTVGSDIAYPPFEYTDEKTGEYTGFDIDLMKEIASRLGLKVKFVNTAWDGIIPGLQAHKYDVICSAMTITEERAKQVDFSDPYFEAKQVILTRADDKSINSAKDLAGKVVAVQQGTTGDFAAQRLVDELGIKIKEIKRFEGTPEALMAVQKGDADAAIIDNFVAYLAVKENPDIYRVVEDPTFPPEYYGIAVNKDNPELLKAINQALKEIKEDGTYDKIYKKWFGE